MMCFRARSCEIYKAVSGLAFLFLGGSFSAQNLHMYTHIHTKYLKKEAVQKTIHIIQIKAVKCLRKSFI